MIKKIFIFLYICFSAIYFAQHKDSILKRLDETILQSKTFEIRKEKELEKKKILINAQLNDEKKYAYNRELAQDYLAFVSDSAKSYALKALKIAQNSNDLYKINESNILYASIEAKTGLFPVALDIIQKIDEKTLLKSQKTEYYKTYSEILIYWLEYMDGQDINNMVSKKNKVRDALLAELPTNSIEYAINAGTKNIEEHHLDEAEKILLESFPKVKPETREYSIYTSILAYLYEAKKDRRKQKEYLALSAISDIEAAVKENLSLRYLAVLLYEEHDIERANFYIKKSLQDANYYHARLRNLQISRILPIIDQAYEIERQKQQTKLRNLLILLSFVSLVLFASVYLVFKQKQKVSKAKSKLSEINRKLNHLNEDLNEANKKEKEMNTHLHEANLVKEQYIHSFMEISTEYIQRLESFKEIVNRKVKTGQTTDILKLTAVEKGDSKELKELYKNFDKAFLNIYPKFTDELNALLKPEEQYLMKDPNSLNHEIRIYALIRLGISDSNQIATFLHYTLRTVYNYRSKVKAKANHPDCFEENILKIGLS